MSYLSPLPGEYSRVHGGVARVVRDVDLGPGAEQHLCRVPEAAVGGQVQQRPSLLQGQKNSLPLLKRDRGLKTVKLIKELDVKGTPRQIGVYEDTKNDLTHCIHPSYRKL